jgi:hypothetical protein
MGVEITIVGLRSGVRLRANTCVMNGRPIIRRIDGLSVRVVGRVVEQRVIIEICLILNGVDGSWLLPSAREAEVADQNRELVREDEVLGLEVAMDDVGRMECRHTRHQLMEVVTSEGVREGSGVGDEGEQFTTHTQLLCDQRHRARRSGGMARWRMLTVKAGGRGGGGEDKGRDGVSWGKRGGGGEGSARALVTPLARVLNIVLHFNDSYTVWAGDGFHHGALVDDALLDCGRRSTEVDQLHRQMRWGGQVITVTNLTVRTDTEDRTEKIIGSKRRRRRREGERAHDGGNRVRMMRVRMSRTRRRMRRRREGTWRRVTGVLRHGGENGWDDDGWSIRSSHYRLVMESSLDERGMWREEVIIIETCEEAGKL